VGRGSFSYQAGDRGLRAQVQSIDNLIRINARQSRIEARDEII
jgi:hypothetical protein